MIFHSDPEHRKQMKKYGGGNWDGGYRDYGVLKYSMRSVDQFMPWIRDIILVTNGQVPTWADPQAPGLGFFLRYYLLQIQDLEL